MEHNSYMEAFEGMAEHIDQNGVERTVTVLRGETRFDYIGPAITKHAVVMLGADAHRAVDTDVPVLVESIAMQPRISLIHLEGSEPVEADEASEGRYVFGSTLQWHLPENRYYEAGGYRLDTYWLATRALMYDHDNLHLSEFTQGAYDTWRQNPNRRPLVNFYTPTVKVPEAITLHSVPIEVAVWHEVLSEHNHAALTIPGEDGPAPIRLDEELSPFVTAMTAGA